MQHSLIVISAITFWRSEVWRERYAVGPGHNISETPKRSPGWPPTVSKTTPVAKLDSYNRVPPAGHRFITCLDRLLHTATTFMWIDTVRAR